MFLPDNVPFSRNSGKYGKLDFSKQECLQWEDSPYRFYEED